MAYSTVIGKIMINAIVVISAARSNVKLVTDILVLVDNHNITSDIVYEQMLANVLLLPERIQVSNATARIGLITFGISIDSVLLPTGSKEKLINEVKSIVRTDFSQPSNMHLALDRAGKIFGRSDRLSAAKVVIVMTDGCPADEELTKLAALKLRRSKVAIYAVMSQTSMASWSSDNETYSIRAFLKSITKHRMTVFFGDEMEVLVVKLIADINPALGKRMANSLSDFVPIEREQPVKISTDNVHIPVAIVAAIVCILLLVIGVAIIITIITKMRKIAPKVAQPQSVEHADYKTDKK